jgi:hypothetical protein
MPWALVAQDYETDKVDIEELYTGHPAEVMTGGHRPVFADKAI